MSRCVIASSRRVPSRHISFCKISASECIHVHGYG